MDRLPNSLEEFAEIAHLESQDRKACPLRRSNRRGRGLVHTEKQSFAGKCPAERPPAASETRPHLPDDLQALRNDLAEIDRIDRAWSEKTRKSRIEIGEIWFRLKETGRRHEPG